MARFKVKFRAYDNFWRYFMGGSLSVGLTIGIAGLGGYGEEFIWIGLGIVCLFPIFALFNYLTARSEAKQDMEAAMRYKKYLSEQLREIYNEENSNDYIDEN